MKRFALIGLAVISVVVLGAGCSKSTAGTVRTATVPRVERKAPPTPPPNIPTPTPVQVK